jgi:putative hydrolase of the HAD superfamily
MLRLDPEAPQALAELGRGRLLGLVSNYDHPRHVRSVLRETGLERYFDSVVVSGEVGVEKPDPAILALALEGTGLRPREAAYVGDSAVDYEAASAAGLMPVLVRRPGQASGDAPAHLRDRYGDPEAYLAAARARGDLRVVGALAELPGLLT